MKRILYIFIAFPLLNFSCSNRSVVVSEDEIPDGRFYLHSELKPFTGKCLVYYSDQKTIKEEMEFKNGILNGRHISYYKNGQVKRCGEYLNGVLNGTWTVYDRNGKRTLKLEYANGSISVKNVA